MPSWSIDSAAKLQQENPYTFYRPSDAVIDRLEPKKATVKLIFNFESDNPELPSAERMWVIINSIDDDGLYSGMLDNDPFYINDLKAGDTIIFKRDDIIDYQTYEELEVVDENAGKIEQYLKKCFVSNQIMHDGYKVGRLYREDSDEIEYTGWTFMSDKETQEYVDDYANLQYISIGKVLNIDDTFIKLLDAPTNSEYAKDE